jgi:hypothetical protein
MSERLQRIKDALAEGRRSRKAAKGGRSARKEMDRLAARDPWFASPGLPKKVQK